MLRNNLDYKFFHFLGKTIRAKVDLNSNTLKELINFCYTNMFESTNTADFLDLVIFDTVLSKYGHSFHFSVFFYLVS
jgi:hypothetical protein